MQLAFLKFQWYNPAHWFIRLFGKGNLVHVELVFSDNKCFSSSPANGTCFREVDLNDDWILVPLNVSKTKEIRIKNFCKKEVGCPYDWNGIFSFVFTNIQPSDEKWFCTEIVITAMQKAELLKEMTPYRVTPQSLYEEAIKL